MSDTLCSPDGQIFSRSPQPIFLLSRSTLEVLAANNAAHSALGYEPSALHGHSFLDLLQPPTPKNIQIDLRQPNPEIAEYCDLAFVTSNRRICYLSISIFEIEYQGEAAWAALACNTTRRHERDQSLVESEQRFHQIASHLPEAIWMRDAETNRTIYVSPSSVEIWGLTPEEIYANPDLIFDVPVSDDRKRHREAILELQNGHPIQTEYRCPRRTGEIRWLRTRGYPITENGVTTRIVGITDDVTERHEAEDRIRRSEERFRTITLAGTDIITLADRTGRREFISGSIERVLGYTPEEMLNKPIFSIAHPDDAQALIDTFTDHRTQPDSTFRVEYRSRHKNGAWRIMEAHVRNLLDDPSVAAMVIHTRDITERRATEARLIEIEGKLHNMTLTDPVSGLHNRTGFLTFADQRLHLMDRLKRPLVLSLFSLTNLREINKRLGPETGDRALGQVANLLTESFRDTDILARIGGSTFGVLAMIKTPQDAAIFLGRFHRRIKEMNDRRDEPHQLHLATGNSLYLPDQVTSLSELIGRAEKALEDDIQLRRR